MVLEVGPGNGEWMRHYDATKVTKIYGVEPNKDHHAALRRKIVETGLSDVYVLCPVGVEELGEKWVGRGEVDCVVTVSFLLSFLRIEELGFRNMGFLCFQHADGCRSNVSARFQVHER